MLGALLCGLGLVGAGVLAPSGVAVAQSGLAAPTELRTAYGQSRTIALFWTEVSGAAGYEYRVDQGSWVSTGSTETRYFVTHSDDCDPRCTDRLVNGTTYRFQVRALDGSGTGGAASAEVTGTPVAMVLSVASGSMAGVNYLAWTPKGGATGYEVEWSSNGATGWRAMSPPHTGTYPRRYAMPTRGSRSARHRSNHRTGQIHLVPNENTREG